MDLACTGVLGAVLLTIVALYGLRLAAVGPSHHARVDAEGASARLAKGTMEMMYWAAQPVVTGCVRAGLTANAITLGSLALGIGAGLALAGGHLGLGALVATSAAGLDAVDGAVARRSGTASDAGEVLDAAVDRYVDFALIAGLAFLFRERAAMLVLALLALLGSFMVSYSTAKAEALHVTPPRGSMRRAERSALLIVGAALSPVAALLPVARAGELPIALALGVLATAGNVSALHRLASVHAGAYARRAPAPPEQQPEVLR